MSGNGTFLYPAITNKLGGGGSGSGDATQAGNNNFTGTNTFTGSVVVPSPTQNNQASNKEYVDNGINGCAKLASANTFTQVNTFNEFVNVLGNKAIQMGDNSSAFKLRLGGANGNNDGFIVSPNGNLRVNEGSTGRVDVRTDITMNNHYIGNLRDPNSAQDAATKNYVDNAITSAQTQITANQNAITSAQTQITANQNAITQVNQELTSVAKVGLSNTFTAINTFNGQTIVSRTPTNSTDVANKAYCDTKQAQFNLASGTPLRTGNIINGKPEYIYYWEGDITAFSQDFPLPGVNNCYSIISGTIARQQHSGTWVALFLRDETNGVQTNVNNNQIKLWITSTGTGAGAFDNKHIRASIIYLGNN